MSASVVAFDEAAGWVDVQLENGTIQRLPISAIGHPDAPHPSASYDPSGPSPPPSPRPSSAQYSLPPPPPAGHVYAVSIPCAGDKRTDPATYKLITILPVSHDIFYERPTPISALVEFPLVVYKTYSLPSVSTPKHLLENEIATTLNIEAGTGIAPAEWRSRVGSVIVARKDKNSLDIRHWEGVWMYIDMIGHKFKVEGTTEDGLRAKGHFTKRDLEHWWKLYERQARSDRAGYQAMNDAAPATKGDADDWSSVPPLF